MTCFHFDSMSSDLNNSEHEELTNNLRQRTLKHKHPDMKRTTIKQLYKSLTKIEFLTKTQSDIRHEFRKMPNPSAKDTHAAK
jgi:hypothetical protein